MKKSFSILNLSAAFLAQIEMIFIATNHRKIKFVEKHLVNFVTQKLQKIAKPSSGWVSLIITIGLSPPGIVLKCSSWLAFTTFKGLLSLRKITSNKPNQTKPTKQNLPNLTCQTKSTKHIKQKLPKQISSSLPWAWQSSVPACFET